MVDTSIQNQALFRYEENANHPFNKAENWQEIPYTKTTGEIVKH